MMLLIDILLSIGCACALISLLEPFVNSRFRVGDVLTGNWNYIEIITVNKLSYTFKVYNNIEGKLIGGEKIITKSKWFIHDKYRLTRFKLVIVE